MSGLTWEFSVFGDPKGQPRPRAFARKMGAKFVARVFESGTAESWKSAIALACQECGIANQGIDQPLRLAMRCHFARPKSHYRTGKNAHLLRDNAPFFHLGKPDLDNVLKAAKDAMTQIGVWRDDSLVCDVTMSKRYTDGASYTEFRIALLNEGVFQRLRMGGARK